MVAVVGSANFYPEEWTESVGKRGKRMRSKKFACSVAFGLSNNQAGNNKNFTYHYPAQHHAEIPVEIPKRCHVEGHVQHPTKHHCNHCLRNQKEPNSNNRSRGYEHYALMATTVDCNTDVLRNGNESVQ
jgi:hypothetical protein